ncbi:hypothetical protein OC846_004981 [Tilletia horrida]|uniref:Thioesterase domain-containing protein n=1 Tax=Tilletia horrida TaxID=155126 RepID=A0AAN6GLM5_9BASI|nr:hypothetical protein OC846_004981 [Tilletia horrida]KAK0554913.1 hypothetical protein OC845_000554 [Tilletia horrida]KAK0562695.1 hypothetical protein OC861_005184 [Tilletia horrida]
MLDSIFHLQGSSSSSTLAPLFLIHPISGFALSYLTLGQLTTNDRPVYGINARIVTEDGCDASSPPATIVSELVEEYILLIENSGFKTRSQPWLLGGWSFGGMIAFAMSCELQARGHQVLDCIMIDSVWPQFYPTLADEFEKEHLTNSILRAIQQRVLPDGNNQSNTEKVQIVLSRNQQDEDEAEYQPESMMEVLDLPLIPYEGNDEWDYLLRKPARSASSATTASTASSSSGPATPHEDPYTPIIWSTDFKFGSAPQFAAASPMQKPTELWNCYIEQDLDPLKAKSNTRLQNLDLDDDEDEDDDVDDDDDYDEEEDMLQLLERVRSHVGHTLSLLSRSRLAWSKPYNGRMTLLRCNKLGSPSPHLRQPRLHYYQERFQHHGLGWNSNGDMPRLRVFDYQTEATHDQCFDQPFVHETTQLLATALQDLTQ